MIETNQLLLSGPLAGEIIPPGRYFLPDFDRLAYPMQMKIQNFAENQGSDSTDMDQLKRDFEDSWERQATDDEPTMWEL